MVSDGLTFLFVRGMFGDLTQLRELYLNNNQIKVIPPEAQVFLSNLSVLELSGNPVQSTLEADHPAVVEGESEIL